ncbi:MAG: alpha/beta hydrolase [Candidatus Nanoarchaeia archaeon]
MEEKVFFEGELGKICAVLYSTNNLEELIIIIHGFPSTKESGAVPISKALNNIGLSTLRIDLDNYGESDLDYLKCANVPNYVKQLDATINFAKTKGYKKISLVGTSFGGLVAMATALKHPEINRLFLRAPLFDIERHMINKFGKAKLKEFEEKGIFPYIKRENKIFEVNIGLYTASKEYSMFKHASKIKQRTLIIQGDMDEEIDYKISQEIINLFPNAELRIIKGANHSLGIKGDFTISLSLLKEFFSNKI